MSLKDLTKEKHTEAENTPFMKAVFAKTLPIDLWKDWTVQKLLFYTEIENTCESLNLLDDLPGIKRWEKLTRDVNEMCVNDRYTIYLRQPVLEYHNYLISIAQDKDKMLAHLYVWHMGDMFGGQMIKKLIKAPHSNLEFENAPMLISNLRSKLTDDLAEEANIAFSWAIKMMRNYDNDLVKN
ncbi:MAG: hypothetical protein EBX47_09130 [Synechococcaceae bacterium WB8_1B_057]|nr:hypothetical protein [Synechococcaceae bacterium WB6_1A_059]NDG79576.1 hypothetical protein [Synechococcaceae bacterium WB8_1B_057]